MKHIFLFLTVISFAVSCDKNTIEQTTDHIKRADSLLTKANDGFKTLDSISKTISQSDRITKKVIIPEIEKQKKIIDSTIKSGSWQMDSINKEIREITKNVKTGTNVVKTLDSAKEAINKGENALIVLTKTADKILKQTKTSPQERQNSSTTSSPPTTTSSTQVIKENPLVKTAKLEIQVQNLNDAKAFLKQKIRETNSDLITENFSQTEGIKKETLYAKVPLQHFDQVVNAAANLGEIRMKSTISDGTEYFANQLCEVEITLVQNENIADNTIISTEPNKDSGESDNAKSAFMKGFKLFEKGILWLLPFWPVLLLGLIIGYFLQKKRRKKIAQQNLYNNPTVTSTVEFPKESETSSGVISTPQENSEEEDSSKPDYSKYMPKN